MTTPITFGAGLLGLLLVSGAAVAHGGAGHCGGTWAGVDGDMRRGCPSWSSSAAVAAAPTASYDYPYRDPYLATITAAVLNPDGLTPGLRREVIRVPVLPGRDRLPALEGRGDMSITFYRSDGPAPLLFILSGIGSNPYFGLSTYFAELFHARGYHVVILPSPMTWGFALTASRSGVPGYAPADARDLYLAMQRTLEVLRARHEVQVKGVSFMGASLGALEGAYLSVLDGEERRIGIQRYLLINPPLDVPAAMAKLDAWRALRVELGREKVEKIGATALGIVNSISESRRTDPAGFRISVAVDRMAKDFSRMSTEELQFLIAENVHTTLPELVYVTQAIRDRGVLAAPADQPRKRLQEAKAVTLLDYRDKIALPTWGFANVASMGAAGSFGAILDRIRDNPRVYVMHNADDVLSDRDALLALKEALGERMTLYPYGGHLGNLWYRENREHILAALGTTTENQRTAAR